MVATPLRLGLASVAVLLAACSAPTPPSTYTLLGALQTIEPGPSRAFAIQTLPVSLPPQVDQPQLLLRSGDGELVPLATARWAAPLGDELQAALSARLTQRLGVTDVAGVGVAADLPTWRIQTDVQRFELPLDGPAVLDATWRIRQDRGAALLCRSIVQVSPQAAGVAGLVGAQQVAVAGLADTIAQAITSAGATPPDTAGVRTLNCTQTAARAETPPPLTRD